MNGWGLLQEEGSVGTSHCRMMGHSICRTETHMNDNIYGFTSTIPPDPLEVFMPEWLLWIMKGVISIWASILNAFSKVPVLFDLHLQTTSSTGGVWACLCIWLYLVCWWGKSYVASWCISILFLLAPAGISLLATESEHREPQFCTRTYYSVAESDKPTKLCMQLLGHGGVVNADLILLDGTARGVCDTYNSTTINSLIIRFGQCTKSSQSKYSNIRISTKSTQKSKTISTPKQKANRQCIWNHILYLGHGRNLSKNLHDEKERGKY